MKIIEQDNIEDILINSELAKQLVPNKFKFTSHQGRIRRHKLLVAAKKLSESKSISEITLADICEEAEIPRASAYHFFPNVEAIFLALRLLNAIEILDDISKIQTSQYVRWQAYLTGIIDRTVEILNDDPTKAKLIYEVNVPDFEGDSYGKKVDHKISMIIYDNLSHQYDMPDYVDIKEVLLISYAIINSVFTLSYRKNGKITEHLRQEAITACIAYMRSYLPEKLNRKNVTDNLTLGKSHTN